MKPAPPPETPHPLKYTRGDAIADGLQIEVPTRLSRQFGIRWPLTVTTLAWFDAIGWDSTAEASKARPTRQSESARIAEVLWAAKQALSTNSTGTQQLPFIVHRVPPIGPETRAVRLTLHLTIHPGDHGETVATIHHPDTPSAGRFHLMDSTPHAGWQAVAFDEDRHGARWPVVTADTLDQILSDLSAAESPWSSIEVSPGCDGCIHLHQPDIGSATLRPDALGHYHLRVLGWPFHTD